LSRSNSGGWVDANNATGGLAADAPDPTDTSPANGIPDYIEDLGAIFENVRSFEVGTRGFLAPPSDLGLPPNDANNRNPDGRYDVFVYKMSPYGYAQPEYLGPETWNDATSFIGIENDFAGFPGTQLGNMQVTAAHEFHHAIQFSYDYQEESWWMETTSTYMEDEVYPAVNDNYNYMPNWFDYCDWYGLKTFDGVHEYGNYIWAKRPRTAGQQVIEGLLALDSISADDLYF